MSRPDGRTDDWVQIGNHGHKPGQRYFSHTDAFGQAPWSVARGDKAVHDGDWRASYYFIVKGGSKLPDESGFPGHVEVTGAGSAEVNGVYRWVPDGQPKEGNTIECLTGIYEHTTNSAIWIGF